MLFATIVMYSATSTSWILNIYTLMREIRDPEGWAALSVYTKFRWSVITTAMLFFNVSTSFRLSSTTVLLAEVLDQRYGRIVASMRAVEVESIHGADICCSPHRARTSRSHLFYSEHPADKLYVSP